MDGIIHGGTIAVQDIKPLDYAKYRTMFERVATNSTQTRSARAGGGVIETLGGSDNDAVCLLGPGIDLASQGATGEINFFGKFTEAATNNQDLFVGIHSGALTGHTTGIFSATAATLSVGTAFGVAKLAELMFFRPVGGVVGTTDQGVQSTTAFASATDYAIKIKWNVVKVVSTTAYVNAEVWVNGVLLQRFEMVACASAGIVYPCICMKATNSNAEVFDVARFTVGNVDKV
jgi:hypothetical protein